MTAFEGEIGRIVYRGYWDDRPNIEHGWYVEYRDGDGVVIDDSVKAWHPALPFSRDEAEAAEEVARRYASELGAAADDRDEIVAAWHEWARGVVLAAAEGVPVSRAYVIDLVRGEADAERAAVSLVIDELLEEGLLVERDGRLSASGEVAR